MRTGTGLFTNVLCGDPSTNPVIAEAQYLTRMLRLYLWGRNSYSAFLADTFATRADFVRFSRGWVEAYLERTRQRWSSCRHLVLKNPEMTPLFPELHELVEESKFLVIVRDPRDTVASMMEVATKQKALGRRTALTEMGDDARRFARFYNSYYERCLTRDFDGIRDVTLFLKYEDLILHTGTALRTIEDFTGLRATQFDPSATGARTARPSDERKEDRFFAPWITEVTGGPISAARIGRFSKALTPDKVAVIERNCADLMARFGYPCSDSIVPKPTPRRPPDGD